MESNKTITRSITPSLGPEGTGAAWKGGGERTNEKVTV